MYFSRMFSTSCASIVMLGVVGVSPAAAQAVNLITNPGFETPVVPAGSFTGFNLGQATPVIPGWTVTGSSGSVALISRTFAIAGFTVMPRSGNQSLDLTGQNNAPTGVQQSVATVVGRRYALYFWVGNTFSVNSFMGTSSTVNVFVNGRLLTSVMNTGGAGLTRPFWQPFSAGFVATSTVTTIAFINADPSSDTANLLDDVTLLAQ